MNITSWFFFYEVNEGIARPFLQWANSIVKVSIQILYRGERINTATTSRLCTLTVTAGSFLMFCLGIGSNSLRLGNKLLKKSFSGLNLTTDRSLEVNPGLLCYSPDLCKPIFNPKCLPVTLMK